MLRRDQVEALLQEATDQEVHSPAEMLLTHDEIEGALPVTFHAVRELCRGYLAWLEVQPRPISEAPRDGTIIWTPDGDKLRRTQFVSAAETATELNGLPFDFADVWADPEDHSDNWEPKFFIASIPTPDKVT